MANVKISDLPMMSDNIDANDVIPIVDLSEGETKKVGVGTIADRIARLGGVVTPEYVDSVVNNLGKYIASDVNNRPFASASALQSGPYYYSGGQIDNSTTNTVRQNDYAFVVNTSNNTVTMYIYQGSSWIGILSFPKSADIYDLLSSDQQDALDSGVTSAWKTAVEDSIYQKQKGLTSITVEDNDGTHSQPNSVSRTDNALTIKLPSTIKAALDGNAATATEAEKADKADIAYPRIFVCAGGGGSLIQGGFADYTIRYNATDGDPSLNEYTEGQIYLMLLQHDIIPDYSQVTNGSIAVALSLNNIGMRKIYIYPPDDNINRNNNSEIYDEVVYSDRLPHGLYILKYVKNESNNVYFIAESCSPMILERILSDFSANNISADDFLLAFNHSSARNTLAKLQISDFTQYIKDDIEQTFFPNSVSAIKQGTNPVQNIKFSLYSASHTGQVFMATNGLTFSGTISAGIASFMFFPLSVGAKVVGGSGKVKATLQDFVVQSGSRPSYTINVDVSDVNDYYAGCSFIVYLIYGLSSDA